MVKYGACMRDVGCEWDMYKEYTTACYAECGNGTCSSPDEEHDNVKSEQKDSAIVIDQNRLLAEIPVEFPAVFGPKGVLLQPPILCNSTDDLAGLVEHAFQARTLDMPTDEKKKQLVAQLKRKMQKRDKLAELQPPVKTCDRSVLHSCRFLDGNRLLAIAHEHAAAYSTAHPFPSIVFDHFFDELALGELVDECEKLAPVLTAESSNTIRFRDQWTNEKWGIQDYEAMGPVLQVRTAIQYCRAVPDPCYSCYPCSLCNCGADADRAAAIVTLHPLP
jgi:hypothetical protein